MDARFVAASIRRRRNATRVVNLNAATRPPEMAHDRVGSLVLINNAAQSVLASCADHSWPAECQSDGSYRVWALPAWQNNVGSPRAIGTSPWSVASATATAGQSSPDGTTNAVRMQILSGVDGVNQFLGSAAVGCYQSCWERSHNGTTDAGQFVYGNEDAAFTTTLTGTWKRIEALDTRTSNQYAVPDSGRNWSAVGGAVAGARDVDLDLAVGVLGGKHRYPFGSGSIGASRTRLFGESWCDTRGYYDITLDTVAGLTPAASIAADGVLWRAVDPVNSNVHELRFVSASKVWQLTVNSVVVATSAAQSYAAPLATGAALGPVRIFHQPTGCGATLGGIGVTLTGAAQAAMSGCPEYATLCSDDSAANGFDALIGGSITSKLSRARAGRIALLVDGDSIARGKGTTGTLGWVQRALALLGGAGWGVAVNAAQDGAKATDAFGINAVHTYATMLNRFFKARPRTVVALAFAFNDATLSLLTEAQIYANILSVVALYLAAGVPKADIAVVAPASAIGSGVGGRPYDTDIRPALATLIRAGAQENGGNDFGFVVDFAADPIMGANNAPVTYANVYWPGAPTPDAVHPNDAGQDRLAAIFRAKLLSRYGY
jgi:lysophospholipase L1-like esterase